MSRLRITQSLTPSQKELLRRYAAPVSRLVAAQGQAGPDELREVFKVLAERLWDAKLNVSFLWRKARVTRRGYVGNLFSRVTHDTPADFIRRGRCAVAAVLILRTEMSLSEVGYAVGYDEASGETFRRNFHRTYGLMPSDFRDNPGVWKPAGGFLFPDATGDDEALRFLVRPHQARAGEGYAADLRRLSAAIPVDEPDVTVAARSARAAVHRCGTARPAGRGLVQGTPVDLFAARLCDGCRQTFEGFVGRDLRRHLRHALALVPTSLDAFGQMCDECYRLLWEAIDRARLGFLDDALLAWRISTTVDDGPDTAASRGLFIHLLYESERLAFRDPRRRLKLCRRAGEVARELGNEDLLQLARIFEGNALRAISRFQEARRVFAQVDTRSRLWLRAFYLRDLGALETDDLGTSKAIDLLSQADALFRELDLHEAGLVGLDLSNAVKWHGHFTEALAKFEDAVHFIDHRRWPEAHDVIPINRGLHQTTIGDYDRAFITLSRRPENPVFLPFYHGALGKLALGRGRYEAAITETGDSVEGLIKLEKYDAAIIESLSLAEAQARDGDLPAAMATLAATLTYSASTTRTKRVIETLRQLIGYAGSAVDLAERLRELAWQNGGALPPLRLESNRGG